VLQGDTVSGDWADILTPPLASMCAVTIGDAMGCGAAAEPSARLLRFSSRALFDCTRDVAATMTALDRLVCRWDGTLATCLTVDIRASGRVTAHSAGHAPPVIIDAHGVARALRVPTAGALGLGRACAPPLRTNLARGATVIMYTDGLITRRGLPLDEGLRWLLDASAGMHDVPVSILTHRLLQQSIDRNRAEDDITVVAARLQ
jgi:serine phosphatase RsbU (regulator of sigma subunit)